MLSCFGRGKAQAAAPGAPALGVAPGGAPLPDSAQQLYQHQLPATAGPSSSSAPRPAAIEDCAAQFGELFSTNSAFGSRNVDLWVNLQKAADQLCAAGGLTCVSINVLTTSRKAAKVLCNTGSPQADVLRRRELIHSSEVPSVLQVASTGAASYTTVAERMLPPDFEFLNREAGCTSFMSVPLFFGRQLQGTLTLASKDTPPSLADSRWIAGFAPMLAIHLAECGAVRLVDTMEKLLAATSINMLAWTVATELNVWFDWCMPDDTEARLVLLSDDKPTALVLSRSPGATNDVPAGLIASGSFTRSGRPTSTDAVGGHHTHGADDRVGRYLSSTVSCKLFEEGLLGTQMSLVNTLTRRCLAEGSKLLFVADVMAALKKYGEPWKDIFMDGATVTNPTWVITAPIMADGKHLGAIIWLSNTRLNPAMLAQAAKSTVPPLLHCVAQQLQGFMENPTRPTSMSRTDAVEDVANTWNALLHLRSTPNLDSPSHGLGLHGMGIASSSVVGRTGLDSGQFDDNVKPVKYTISRTDSASTSALMRVYQTAIAQHQRASSVQSPESGGSNVEEIEVIAKAGQGAFGSVYVAMWKGMVVAVKVMKQSSDGRRAMRTAWELAVTRSLQHPNVVMVYQVLTDVLVEKRSKRVIRFVPSTVAVEMDGTANMGDPGALPASGNMTPGMAGASVTGNPNSANGFGGSSAHPGVPPPVALSTEVEATEGQPRCHVIIMEYCNLGPLHHYVAERRFVRGMHLDNGSHAAGTDLGSAPGSSLHNGGAGPAQGGSQHGSQSEGFLVTGIDMPMITCTLLEVATAMTYLHGNGFIHCDLKPENILLKVAHGDTRGFMAKVSDFGLSELFTVDGPLMGELGGTVTHIAPEIVTQKRVSKAADVYSFGIIMWEMLTGQRPYAELLAASRDKRVRDKTILSRVAHEGMRPEFPANSPPEYVRMAQACWNADATLRPTFTELAAELRSLNEMYSSAAGVPRGSAAALAGLAGPPGGQYPPYVQPSLPQQVPVTPMAAAAPATPLQQLSAPQQQHVEESNGARAVLPAGGPSPSSSPMHATARAPTHASPSASQP